MFFESLDKQDTNHSVWSFALFGIRYNTLVLNENKCDLNANNE